MHELIESYVMVGRLLFYNPCMFLKLPPSSLSTLSWGKFRKQENVGVEVVLLGFRGSGYVIYVAYSMVT